MSFNSSPLIIRRNRYRLVDKLRIADSALACGWIKRTARVEGVSPTNIRRWISQRQDLAAKVKAARSSKLVNQYRVTDPCHSLGDDVEAELLAYYRDCRAAGLPVTVRLLVRKWALIDPEGTSTQPYNKARFRVYRFMKRHNITSRAVTHQAQNKETSRSVIEDFVGYINEKIDLLGITYDAVANFDETNVYFAPEFRRTLADKGSRTVTCKKLKSSRRCTVMLGCTAVGKLLPPYVIWQGKPEGRIAREIKDPAANGLPDGLCYGVQHKAWMDEREMLRWVKQVWEPFTETIDGPTLLIIDEARAHLTSSVRTAIALCQTELEIIPGGFTSKLQVMDVGLNKPFKDRMRDEVEGFMLNAGVGQAPHRTDVARWIKSSWERMPVITVLRTWRRIGFTLHPNGIDTTIIDERSDDDSDSSESDDDPIGLVEPDDEEPDTDSEDEDEE